MSGQINLLELESLRSSLIEKTLTTGSNSLRLFCYFDYFNKILSYNNPNLAEAFLKEFLDDFSTSLSRFEIFGVEPGTTAKIIEQVKKLISFPFASENVQLLASGIKALEIQQEKLTSILEGKEYKDTNQRKAYFPLIVNGTSDGFFGIIESITVRIRKASDDNRFIIVPSETEIEKKILEQCKKSWFLALKLSKEQIKKPFKFHEILITFDKKEGFYEGNSLGISLTLTFLEELLKFYNPAYIINIKGQSAFTGGVTETGKIVSTNEEIINRKTAAVFYSGISTFVFPKSEELYANAALIRLEKLYPDRKLKLVPVSELNDIMNRRDLVDIRKQKLLIKTGKFVKRHLANAAAAVILTIVFTFFFAIDLDDNPESAYFDSARFGSRIRTINTCFLFL